MTIPSLFNLIFDFPLVFGREANCLFSFAAADTTATSLVFIIYHLVTNPQTWTSLAKEIRTTFEKEEDLTYQALASLPYLDAVIHEGSSSFNSL